MVVASFLLNALDTDAFDCAMTFADSSRARSASEVPSLWERPGPFDPFADSARFSLLASDSI